MDISATLQAKSDQLNALDLGGDLTITVTAVNVNKTDQPVVISFANDNGKPWKPSLGMRRILAECWGKDSSSWIGRSATIYCDPKVMWAGKETGGIRIRALSHIDQKGHKTILRESRQKTVSFFVKMLNINQTPDIQAPYPQDQFDANLPQMKGAMQNGWTLEQVIAECEKVGQLTDSQIEQLKAP